MVQGHPWTFVNDNYPIPVSEVHQLVSIGVVGGPVGVSPGPLDQVVVPGEQSQVQTLPADVGVLVTTKPSDNLDQLSSLIVIRVEHSRFR